MALVLFVRGVLVIVSTGGDRRRDSLPESLSRWPLLLFVCSQRCPGLFGVHLQGQMAARLWVEEKYDLHINIVEIKVVQLALATFRDQIMGSPWPR